MLEMRAIVMLLRNHTFYNDTYEEVCHNAKKPTRLEA